MPCMLPNVSVAQVRLEFYADASQTLRIKPIQLAATYRRHPEIPRVVSRNGSQQTLMSI